MMLAQRGRPSVLRISLPWMIEVVASLDRLDRLEPGMDYTEALVMLYATNNQIEQLTQSIYSSYLRASRQRADDLHQALSGVLNDRDEGAERGIDGYHVAVIKQRRDHFKLVFLSEISTLPVFLATPKESFDISILIDDGLRLFPESLSAKVPESAPDAMEVGRALAYELATAAGFHVFRVTESVLKRYWDTVSHGKTRPKLETIGSYAGVLAESKFGDERIWESLKQMAKLHRNPLIHPEVILTVEEAIGIQGIARSVIGAMLAVLPDVPPTTGAVPQ